MRSSLVLTVVCVGMVVAGDAHAYEVEYWEGNQPQILRPLKSAPNQTRAFSFETLPLVQTEPALLDLGGETYSLEQEGLYRIRDPNGAKVVRQSIVYRGDVWRFAGHLSRVYVYGARHQSETQEQWDEHVRNGEPLSLQCGYISMFVRHHLSRQKIGARLVGCTASSNWKQYDDGHALMEICDPVEKRWILFDPTLGARFKDGHHWLSLWEATRLYRRGVHAEHIEFLNANQKSDPLTDYAELYTQYIPKKPERLAFVTQFKPLLKNDVEAIHNWYGRVMQVPVIDLCFVPDSDAEDALLRTLPCWKDLVRMSPAEFRRRFYDPLCCDSSPVEAKDSK